MKKILFVLLAVAISHGVVSQSKDETAVAAAVEALRKAMVDADKKSLENLAAPDLSYGHSSGMVEDKAAFVEAIVSGKSDFVTITLSEQTIKIADNTAIVRHKLVGDTNNGGTPGKINLAILLVWQKQKGEWKLLARQAVRLTP
jgi:ketosteroid isomerase-like protein